MGNSQYTPQSKCFSEKEVEKISNTYQDNFTNNNNQQNQELSNSQKEKNLLNFSKKLFGHLQNNFKIDILGFINKCLEISKRKKIQNFNEEVFLLFAELVLKANNSTDSFMSNYYLNNNYIYIIYDLILNNPNYHRRENLETQIIFDIFDHAIEIYISLHDDEDWKKALKDRYSKEKFFEYLEKIFEEKNLKIEQNNQNLLNKELFDNYCTDYLLSFDCLLRDYFSKMLIDNNKLVYYAFNAIPTFQLGVSNILRTHEFFYYCMANPFLVNKKHAYKLYDCNSKGFNISSLIYSFLGFDGPITIFIHTLDNNNNKCVVGMYINSNFKECFENYVGDDACFVFQIHPVFKMYKSEPLSSNRNRILYLSSKNHKNTDKKAGIGLGYSYFGAKIWLDLNNPFKESYFVKNDNVFQEGGPYEENKTFMNVRNLLFLFFYLF